MEIPPQKVRLEEVEMKTFSRDTVADAVVLMEMGTAVISNDDADFGALVFEHYQKIKILKRSGFEKANVEIILRKSDKEKEELIKVVASTYNLEGGKLKQVGLKATDIFLENRSKYINASKFTLPDVRVGSVIEIRYSIKSQFRYNFRTWHFQSDMPKIHSEYWTLIPGNYIYNITLKGFLRLKSNVATVSPNCFTVGGGSADCALTKYIMEDIPAFREEEFMTARRNFMSAITFELSEIQFFDGHVNKITKEWKDVDEELSRHDGFGSQIRKAKNLFDDHIDEIISRQTDSLLKAKRIYDYFSKGYEWNDRRGIVTELGVKAAFEKRKGNCADINLSLTGALQAAGLNASPVLLSTRENGLPVLLHPVISDFDYVVVALTVGGRQYLLDATNKKQPFGMLPMQCLNGKGRLMAKESRWIELQVSAKQRSVLSADLQLSESGYEGTMRFAYDGYDAEKKRMEIASATDLNAYKTSLAGKMADMEITNCQILHLDSLDNELSETLTVKYNDKASSDGSIFFSPFIAFRWDHNPFRSDERFYPVDFGAPLENTMVLTLTYPQAYMIDELPAPMAMALPAGGGRYTLSTANIGNKVTVTSQLLLNKPVYSAAEYHYLRELFARLVQIQEAQIVFKRK